MGSVLARLFRPDPQDVWIKLSKPVLDKYFESVQLSDEKLIHQAALVNFHFEEDPTLPPAAQLDFVEQFKLYLLLSARVQLADIAEKNFGRLGGRREAWNFHILFIPSHTRDFDCEEDDSSELSDYRRWVPKETFVSTLLSGQQVEQLYVPGTKEPHILAYHYLKSRFCLTRLIPNFSDATMYTVFERRLWSATEFTFTWPSLRVEELCPPVDPQLCPLRKEDFCPFMLWVTLPREYLRVMTDCTLQSTWNFGMITEQVSFMGDHFNFSFSPRSSLLLHTFNISISQVQGTFRMDQRYFDAPVTIGFRPLWQDWESNGRTLWNRYYLDYFVHFQRPIQLNFRSLSRTLLNHTFVSCVHHGLNTLHLVQYFNSFRSSPELSMLMHIPMTRDQRRAVENWNFPGDTPWYIVIEAARSRL